MLLDLVKAAWRRLGADHRFLTDGSLVTLCDGVTKLTEELLSGTDASGQADQEDRANPKKRGSDGQGASHDSAQLQCGPANTTSDLQVKTGTVATLDPATIWIACTLAKVGMDVLAHQHPAETLDDELTASWTRGGNEAQK